MAQMTRQQFAKTLQDGLNVVWGLEYDAHPDEYSMVFEVDMSEKAYEEDQLITGLGLAQEKSEGSEYALDGGMEGWTKRYTHRTVALSFEITEEAVEDNRYVSLGAKYARAMAGSFKQTKEVYSANVLNGAADSSRLGGDGVPLLSNAHPLMGGGVGANTPDTPVDLSEGGVEQVLTLIRTVKDDRGIPKMLKPMKLVVAPGAEFNAVRVTDSNLRSGTDHNDINAIKMMGFFQSAPVVLTNLTDPDAWFITTNCKEGLKHMCRVKMTKPKMSIDMKTGNFCYRARERYSEGHTDWRGVFGSIGQAG